MWSPCITSYVYVSVKSVQHIVSVSNIAISKNRYDIENTFVHAMLREAASNAGKAGWPMGCTGHRAESMKKTDKQVKVGSSNLNHRFKWLHLTHIFVRSLYVKHWNRHSLMSALSAGQQVGDAERLTRHLLEWGQHRCDPCMLSQSQVAVSDARGPVPHMPLAVLTYDCVVLTSDLGRRSSWTASPRPRSPRVRLRCCRPRPSGRGRLRVHPASRPSSSPILQSHRRRSRCCQGGRCSRTCLASSLGTKGCVGW